MYKTIANTVNCGYARVAMQEQTESDFKRFFQAPLSIGNEYFETKQGGKTRSQFETHSKAIKAMFSKKWHPQSSKVEYKNAFSITKWDALSDEPTIQSEVEEPELYLIAINPSTIEDQASIIPDRVADLHDLKEPILSTAGIPVQDVLRFFTGDHPAAQFERGTQVGGKYKCGGCGCKATIMDDQAHALRCKTRSFKELQTIALQGVLGKVPCSTKALYVPDLSVTDIRKELGARGWDCSGKKRPQLQDELQGILQGIQRVPSLILLHPEEQLVNLNLQHYTVVDCEPLHDIKGHLLNLFQELPSVLPNEIKEKCEIRINLCQKKRKKAQQIFAQH
eukprot:Em0207g2a